MTPMCRAPLHTVSAPWLRSAEARPRPIEVHLVDGRRSARPGEAALAHDEADGARAVAAMEPTLRRQAAA